MEFASVLRFIETIFGLPPLTSRDANLNDMLDAFDYEPTASADYGQTHCLRDDRDGRSRGSRAGVQR
jgi:hypothetical protein